MSKLLKMLYAILCDVLCDVRGWTTEMAITGVSTIDATIPEFWAEGIIADGNRQSFWGSLAGKEGSSMPVIDKTGPLNQAGDRITFNTLAQLMGTGVTGENVLKGNEEVMTVGTFTVSADIVRHAVGISKKSTKQAAWDEVKRAKMLLTDWMSRKLDADVFTTITGHSSVETLYAGGLTAVGSLTETAGSYFGPAEISMLRLALTRQGAQPLKTFTTNGRVQPIYGCVFGEIEEYWLMQNTTFVNTIKETFERFKAGATPHPLFNGVIGMYGKMLLYPYYSLLQIPQGTPLRPETTIYTTLTTTATTLTVGGATASSGAKSNYTQFFATSGSLQIGDEIISYTGKGSDLNTFTGLTRGASGTTAIQHSQNALVTQRNIATVIAFGAETVCRAFPDKAEPIGEKDDYGAQIGLGIEAYYGHAVNIDARRTKAPGVVMMKVYSDNPGTV